MRIAALVLLVAACGKGDKPAGSAAGSGAGTVAGAAGSAVAAVPAGGPAAPAGGPFDQLTVTVDGAPVKMQRAFIKRVSPDQWRIQAGDLEGSCEELLSGVTKQKPGGTSFAASIGRRLAPDGSDAIVVTDFWSGGHPTASVTSTAAISGTADRGSPTFVTLTKIIDIDKTRKLEVSGSFTATGCGDQATPTVGLPRAKHPTTATLTIAGKRLPVLSATRTGDAIVLSTGPRDCTPPTVPAQATIEHRAGGWELTGTWFAQPSASTDNAAGQEARTRDLKIGPSTIGTSDDGPTVTLELAGSGKLGDYPVELAGTIEALDCPRPR